MLLRFGFTTWAIERKRCIGFIPLSIEVGSLEFFWIRARWAASGALGSNCYRPGMPSFNWWDLTSMVTLSVIWIGLVKVVERVQQEGRKIPDLQTTYPNVTFRSKSEWESANTDLADGMGKLISTLKEKKDDIKRQRIQQGIEEKFSKLTNKDLTTH